MNRHGLLALARGAFVVVALLLLTPAWAVKTIMVNSVLDAEDDDLTDFVCHTSAGTCTLRAAVMQANYNENSVTDRVKVVVPAGTYVLTLPRDDNGGGSLYLSNPRFGSPVLEIAGAGALTTVVDANHVDRVFKVAPTRTALISGLTLRNGSAGIEVGGGIVNAGNLTLDSVVVTQSSAAAGGGIFSEGSLTVNRSSILANVAVGVGGGICNDNSTSTGAINTMSIFASTIAGNSASGGGGIYNNATMVVVDSTIANNGADSYGGGVYDLGFGPAYTANIYNSTIAFNDADQIRQGGAGGGMAVGVINGGNALNIYNTIVAGNLLGNAPIADDCYGPLATHARNRFGDTSGCTITQISGSYALLTPSSLGPLQNNGGPTQTIVLGAGSNAIDGGDPVNGCRDQYSTVIATDQRGFARNVGICDIGAFEFAAIDPNDKIFRDGFDLVPI